MNTVGHFTGIWTKHAVSCFWGSWALLPRLYYQAPPRCDRRPRWEVAAIGHYACRCPGWPQLQQERMRGPNRRWSPVATALRRATTSWKRISSGMLLPGLAPHSQAWRTVWWLSAVSPALLESYSQGPLWLPSLPPAYLNAPVANPGRCPLSVSTSGPLQYCLYFTYVNSVFLVVVWYFLLYCIILWDMLYPFMLEIAWFH